MSAHSLDTNALLRWLLGDSQGQADTVTQLLASGNTFHVADMAIQEVAYVLEKALDIPRTEVADNIRLIMSESAINCNRTLFERVLAVYVQHPALSFVDCCLAVYADLNGATPLYTFDKALAKKLPTQTCLLS